MLIYGVWCYDGNSKKPFLFVPLSLYDTDKYKVQVSYVTIQGMSQYTNELLASMCSGCICIYTSDVTGNTYNGRLGVTSLTIFEK